MSEQQSPKTYKRPAWVKASETTEEELCPDCFKVVGVLSRYKLVCHLGKLKNGANVTELTRELGLTQPTITHHLQTLQSVDAVTCERRGRECIYRLNRTAHCFDECQIPY